MTEIGFYIKKGWPLFIILVVVAIALYFNHSISADYKGRIVVAEQGLSSVKAEIALSQKRTNDYRSAIADLDSHLAYMYTKQDPQKLMDRLKSDAADYRVQLSDVQIDVPRFFKDRYNPETVVLVKFQASFKGDYYRLSEFLEAFEKRPYLDRIEDMNVAINKPDGSELKMNIKGILRVFDKNIMEWCAEYGT